MSFNIENAPSQKGKIAIVTGANIGLGYETSIGLAKKGAKVIMACRNLEKAEKAKLEIEQKVQGADLEIIQLDLNSLDSVRNFAESYKNKYNQLDLLIENAGIMIPPFTKTKDGFESQMGVNYFSHFLLTNLLFPLLNNTDGSRIVTLSSIAHENGKIDFENLNAEKGYSKMGAYGQSKLACLMFAYELQRRIDKSGSKVLALSAHPGVSNTNLGQHVPRLLYKVLLPIISLFSHSPQNAALPTLLAAIDTDVEGADYYGPSGFRGMNGKPAKLKSKPQSYDKEVAKKLWEASEKLTEQKFNI